MPDSYQTLRCPACGNVMKKIFIPALGINIDICTEGCGGLYFDCKELQMFQKGSDAGMEEINEALAGRTYTPVAEDQVRVCPSCATKMVKTFIKGLNVQVDTCYNCGGVFLDYGELDSIRSGVKRVTVNQVKQQNLTPNNNDVLREYFREAQKEEHNYRKFNYAMDTLFRPRYGRHGRTSCFIDLLYLLFS